MLILLLHDLHVDKQLCLFSLKWHQVVRYVSEERPAGGRNRTEELGVVKILIKK